jgi:hypothetical protein
MGFREIDIDNKYWATSSSAEKTTEMYHELTHCLCGRDHDFGKDQRYPEPETLEIFVVIKNMCVEKTEPKGLYEDGCPLSVMYPRILSGNCLSLHYNDYIKEMFDRCNPW